jgi:hypothetical protein
MTDTQVLPTTGTQRSENGLVLTLTIPKILQTTYKEADGGYFPPNQAGTFKEIEETTVSYDEIASTTSKVVLEHNTIQNATISFDVTVPDVGSGGVSTGFVDEYRTAIEQTQSSTYQQGTVVVAKTESTITIAATPQGTQIWDCVQSIGGEIQRTFRAPEGVPSETPLNVTITADFSDAARNLYATIQTQSVGTDTGEWGTFNQIGATALASSRDSASDQGAVWVTFVNALRNGLWTDGEDQGSWSIVKGGAQDAYDAGNLGGAPAAQRCVTSFQHFCFTLQRITDPSHNDWAWADVRNAAVPYAAWS